MVLRLLCVCSTTLYFYFLSFPCHFYHCRLVLFLSCCVSLLPVFILCKENIMGLLHGLVLSPFVPSFLSSLGITSYQTSPWGFYPFLSSFLKPLWPIRFHLTFISPLTIPVDLLGFTSFFRLSWPVCLALTSYSICGPAGPLDFISIFIL